MIFNLFYFQSRRGLKLYLATSIVSYALYPLSLFITKTNDLSSTLSYFVLLDPRLIGVPCIAVYTTEIVQSMRESKQHTEMQLHIPIYFRRTNDDLSEVIKTQTAMTMEILGSHVLRYR